MKRQNKACGTYISRVLYLRGAFTLVELVIVSVLIMLIFSITVPNIAKRYDKAKAENLLENIMAMWEFAQLKSVETQKLVCLKIDLLNRRYYLYTKGMAKAGSFLNRPLPIPSGVELKSTASDICVSPAGNCKSESLFIKSKNKTVRLIINPDDCNVYRF